MLRQGFAGREADGFVDSAFQADGDAALDLAAGQQRPPRAMLPERYADVRSRDDLVTPDQISSDEPFELPHVNGSRAAVELESPEFETPSTPGRARMSSWSEE